MGKQRDVVSRRSLGRLLAVLVVFGFALTTTGAGTGARPQELRLTVEGVIDDIVSVDLNGDSLKDLLVLSVKGRSEAARRFGSVFLQKAGRQFPTRPDLVWELERSISALDPFNDDLPQAERGTLFSLGADGIYAHRLDGERGDIVASRILKADLSYLPPQEEATLLLDFAAPWSGGPTEFLVPAFPHPLLFRPREKEPGDPIRLQIPPVPSYSLMSTDGEYRTAPLRASFRFQKATPVDQNGDGKRDLVSVGKEVISVLDLPSSPPADGNRESRLKAVQPRIFPLDVLSDDEVRSERCSWRGDLVGLSGNGRKDMVASVTCGKGSFYEFEGRFLTFRSRPDGSFPRQPDHVFQIQDAMYNSRLIRDLDADGRVEITVPSVNIGMWAMIRAFTTRKVAFQFVTVTLGPDATFDPSRAWKDPVTLRLSSSYDLPVVLFCNADDDKVTDLVIGTAEDEVCVFPGKAHDPAHRFSSSASLCFETDPYASFSHADLDADGKEELIVKQTQSKTPGQLSVFLFP